MANQDGILVRLGSVFYWLGCSLAAILVLIGLVVLIFTEDRDWQSLMIYAALSLIPAFLFWIVGRTLKYILCGR